MGTRAANECFYSFFEFSQTFTSVCLFALDFYEVIVDEAERFSFSIILTEIYFK